MIITKNKDGSVEIMFFTGDDSVTLDLTEEELENLKFELRGL